eukprot:4339059-Alexandrium_andersonii.AAC.1
MLASVAEDMLQLQAVQQAAPSQMPPVGVGGMPNGGLLGDPPPSSEELQRWATQQATAPPPVQLQPG